LLSIFRPLDCAAQSAPLLASPVYSPGWNGNWQGNPSC